MEERVAMNTFEVGSIFKMTLRPEEGVKPKHSQDTDRTKYFVVIGISSDRIVVGSVLINSHINPKLFNIIGPYQHLISWEDYTFLTKPESFIDCYNIKEIKTSRILEEAEYIGSVNGEDMLHVISLAISSPANKKAVLLKYHLINNM